MSDTMCMHYLVTGKVQGVWFRASTQDEANRLGVTGWVRNLNDGRVEVMACGSSEQLKQLYTWLQHGPPLAHVMDCIQESVEHQDFVSFEVR